MKDKRLERLNDAISAGDSKHDAVKITRIKLTDYKFFHGLFELTFTGKNVLIYGENGTGKSSLFKALGYLARKQFADIANERNIFSDNTSPSIEFGFSNGRELVIDSDLTELPGSADFIKGLSIFRPMLDYKRLLRVHYSATSQDDTINIYDMLRELFRDYVIQTGGTLADIKDPAVYFSTLQTIVNDILLDEANNYILYFGVDFKITRFIFRQEFAVDGSLRPVIQIEVEFREQVLSHYHSFLNEARLTALAISLYFAAIKKLLGTLGEDCLKLLVLDDLLISLDMSNRLKLLEILKAEFQNFQIFFFTHDKELFDLYSNQLDWDRFEFYLDDTDTIHKAIVKKGSTDLEKAKAYFGQNEFDACALHLRKSLENAMKKILPYTDQRNKNFMPLDLAGLMGKAISLNQGEINTILNRLNTSRQFILNELCHNNNRNIFARELSDTIKDLEQLYQELNNDR